MSDSEFSVRWMEGLTEGTPAHQRRMTLEEAAMDPGPVHEPAQPAVDGMLFYFRISEGYLP